MAISKLNKKEVLTQITQLYALKVVRKDLHLFLPLLAQQAPQIASLEHQLIKQISTQIDPILESLNVATHALYTPITHDYAKYNSAPNFGEVVNAKL